MFVQIQLLTTSIIKEYRKQIKKRGGCGGDCDPIPKTNGMQADLNPITPTVKCCGGGCNAEEVHSNEAE